LKNVLKYIKKLFMDISTRSPYELQQLLGTGIRAQRIARELTQSDVASKAGISKQAVAKLERAEGSTVETLVRVLHALRATQLIESLATQPHVSPLALLRSAQPPQRVRHRRMKPNA
jgi:transcriptional regulator with XRE-family HTH domain